VDGGFEQMINKYTTELIKNKDISAQDIDGIISLKQQYWHYSYDSQVEWISKNIDSDDYHLLIKNDNNILAYMNLVNRYINNKKVLGIGNVCVDQAFSGKGLGKLLMYTCQYFSKQLRLDLILLCKSDTVKFYEKCGFHICLNKIYINNVLFEDYLMFDNEIYDNEREVYINGYF
jgi:predicted GNAT family N-acyltransferase